MKHGKQLPSLACPMLRMLCMQKPSDAELQQLVGPVGAQLVAAGALVDGPRSKYLNHFKLVAEAMQGLTWVVYTGPACGEESSMQFGVFI